MKTLTVITTLLLLTVQSFAQRQISYSYSEIKKVQYDSCSEASYLVANPQIKKQSGTLSIPIIGKHCKVFKDNTSDENFAEYEYLGDIKGARLSLVKLTDYNSEEFYLINLKTGAIDTLIGEPVFSQNLKDFACVNNPGTDEKQRVQICEIKNGSVQTRIHLRGRPNTFLEEISCIKRNSLVAKDNKGKLWKLSFHIEGE